MLAGWGPTIREQRAIAAKQEAERAAAQASSAKPNNGAPAMRDGPVIRAAARSPIPGVPGRHRAGAQRQLGSGTAPAFGWRLPGLAVRRRQTAAAAAQAPTTLETRIRSSGFLREIHASACKYFGTVLGPEANNAHKNHFHLDMAPRKTTNFCE